MDLITIYAYFDRFASQNSLPAFTSSSYTSAYIHVQDTQINSQGAPQSFPLLSNIGKFGWMKLLSKIPTIECFTTPVHTIYSKFSCTQASLIVYYPCKASHGFSICRLVSTSIDTCRSRMNTQPKAVMAPKILPIVGTYMIDSGSM